ncbi:hypothetical protein EPUS_03955 [Endocarpon pusillum Z07020]|uniref:DUF726 domain protein n=1 Tax=Endocarpon pusillum (strain Z07020 / HMAS-L-300199) TaxID=1263415 RepID=U1GAH3_ENDPU|nr:uncharacterized protein EPUS_03955 [Endocarpon pusillum Z07020]ERF74517.1 hypothetical protein EPUS_03955 [Endocarpon pusillum Z07020]
MGTLEIAHKGKHSHASPASDEDARLEDEVDDFGLPKNRPRRVDPVHATSDEDEDEAAFHDAEDHINTKVEGQGLRTPKPALPDSSQAEKISASQASANEKIAQKSTVNSTPPGSLSNGHHDYGNPQVSIREIREVESGSEHKPVAEQRSSTPPQDYGKALHGHSNSFETSPASKINTPPSSKTKRPSDAPAVSEWSHQRLAPQHSEIKEEEDEGDDWQAMPALAKYDLYDDEGKLLARGAEPEDEEEATYGGLGGAGKGYTRVQLDEDAKSATSMDEDTGYLFKESQKHNVMDDEEQRDAVSQLQATKDLLTEGQRIAYVGVTRLTMFNMTRELEDIEATRTTKKELSKAFESMTKWGQQMMVRLYAHMEIDSAEQVMIEQLTDHGVQPTDLVPPLMQTSRVANPMADTKSPEKLARPEDQESVQDKSESESAKTESEVLPRDSKDEEQVPRVHTPSQMESTAKIDLDLRWTVLCDLFLLLISDSLYDARSRRLLEQVAKAMDVSWTQICRFEKRVIDALEMQEEANKENWNEEEHMETRRKLGLRRKYMVMGLATVGGGLVIGLSAGLLAPVIGAGLAAGFTTIGVTGTAGFLGGVGGAALITSAATAAGGTIAVRASHRRTGAVKTFEYRPLHNNKRLNLILTVSGWMNGKVDDVRLPYSTVDPIMGDIYSLLWEPEMLQSMGDTINILATEALTQTVQQVLGSTILVALMASLQLPIVLSKLSYLIDNPWTVSLDRANSAGLILADSLIDRHLGNRPITLLGFSLGSRLIFSCLKELAARGAYGIVQNVYLFGSPIVAKKDEYLRARSVICGRFVNGYASNDWILGYLFRATSGGIMRVAGLAPVEGIPGLENLDVTQLVNGHMAYRTAMPKLLREVGWEVESDEFTEIEDPDPENHQKRQRELIREIDEARKEADAKPQKTRFGFFKRGNLAEKKGWETYQTSNSSGDLRKSTDGSSGLNGNVLFDIEAIRKELESEMIEVRQLESTLPPIQIDLNGSAAQQSPYSNLRHTKSSDASMGTETRTVKEIVEKSLPRPLPEELADVKLPPRPSDLDDDHPSPDEEREIRMTFDNAFEAPRELPSTLAPLSVRPDDRTPSPFEIPELKTSATLPTSMSTKFGSLNLEHNAWADEDEDFSREREMRMTFE